MLPFEMLQLIVQYAVEYKFWDWIEVLPVQKHVKLYYTAKNPLARELEYLEPSEWESFGINNSADWAVDIFLRYNENVMSHHLNNHNPQIFQLWLLRNSFSESNMRLICAHPSSISFFVENPDLLPQDNVYLLQNPNLTFELAQAWNLDVYHANNLKYMLSNPQEWAVDIVLQQLWTRKFSPGEKQGLTIFDLENLNKNTNCRIIAFLTCHPEYILWDIFSSNPNAFAFLNVHRTKITDSIFANPSALQPSITVQDLMFLL